MNQDDYYAKNAFAGWLAETNPWICERGDRIIWRGYSCGKHGLFVRYRVAVHRGFRGAVDIEVWCSNDKMYAWMIENKAYIKGKVIWYCRAVWNLLEENLLDEDDFDKTEAEVELEDEDDGLDPDEREARLRQYWDEVNAEARIDAQLLRCGYYG